MNDAKPVNTADLLVVDGLAKDFDGVRALRGAQLEVRAGEIHALLGENGAGKSTLVKVLAGMVHPDSGTIRLDGEPVRLGSPRAAERAGIAVLHQELAIIPTLSVAENIALGHTPSRGGFVSWSALSRLARTQLERLGQSIPIDRLAGGLSPIQQTMIALARTLVTEARVLILDEPTAALTDSEITRLFEILRKLRDEGVAIIYVSHRLEEVFDLSDRYTVMRNGATVATGEIASTTVDDVIRAMVGREPGELYPPRAASTGPVVLEVRGVAGSRVGGLDLQVHAGEIVAIGGLAGSGRSELLRLLSGAQRRSSGDVLVDGRKVAGKGVAASLAAGIAYVPEERRAHGVDLEGTVTDNITVASLRELSTAGWMSARRALDLTRRSIAAFGIRAHGPGQPVGQLSGGNQQKVVLAKVLARAPRVLLVDEPTRGIDVGARAEIYRLLRQLSAAGTAIVLVSSDLPELIGLADRVIVVRNGRIVSELAAHTADEETVLAGFYGKAS
ncbi:sugar ABC transporter ATP-binding protein [Pseudolysinimonas yzui]|uniref:Ribose import ATP-binding protein RbsA n=1 Tax=Pseudolysinimonas yzui TaxID=2708254 RepID=A0A8J3M253_9MICO|nr:sugar ABC transporter ATP-binding protein [Pseudolysinimonas yzui]GHF23713.1 ribose import ATP-binding protein RbsA [Pseudolysinimonas yzui]